MGSDGVETVMMDTGTCPVCGREDLRLNMVDGMVINHLRPNPDPPPDHLACPGSHKPPAESRAWDS